MNFKLNREEIKLFAIFAMTLNHIAHFFLKNNTPEYILMESIGYFTAITMCYFLVEGYYYTRSKFRYALRLFLFGIISQIPYSFFISNTLNMMFSLFGCFFIILINDKVKDRLIKVLLTMLLIPFFMICDWDIRAPLFTILFIWANKDNKKVKIVYFISILISFILFLISKLKYFDIKFSLLFSFINSLGLVLSAICILYFYNGKQSKYKNKFMKLLFYIYYPLHLYILMFVKIII